jgi:hypothetical protein
MNDQTYIKHLPSQHHIDLLAEYVQQASHSKLCIVNSWKDYDKCRIMFTYSNVQQWEAIRDGVRLYEEDKQKSRTQTIL